MKNFNNKMMNYLGVEEKSYGLLKCIYFAFLISGLMSISIGLIIPFIREENMLTYEETSSFLSAHQIGNLLAILLAGFLPYKIGRKQSTVILGSGIFIGLFLMIVTKNPIILVTAFILSGVGRGTLTNISNVTISQYTKNKTEGLNLLHATFATGALLAPFLILISTSLNQSFRVSAGTISFLSLISMFLLFKSKLSSKPSEKNTSGTWDFLKKLNFWIDTLVLFFYLCAETSIIGWFVIYFYDLGILPDTVANFTPSMLWLMIMIGRLFCASISNKFEKPKLLFVMGGLMSLFFGMLLYSQTAILAIISLLGIGFFMSGIYPTTVATMKGTDNTIQVGFYLSFATFGGIIMPKIVGGVADERGLTAGIFMVLIALLIMMLLISLKWFLYEKNREANK